MRVKSEISPKTMKSTNSYSYNLNFLDQMNIFEKDIKAIRNQLMTGSITKNVLKQFFYTILGSIQLRNGSRISEAIESLKDILLLNSTNVETKVLKRSDNFKRSVILPNFITLDDLTYISDLILNNTNKSLVSNISNFYKKQYGFGTHALRHAFITYLGIEKNIPAQVISKITGHKNLNQIIGYTDSKKANNILENIME